MRYFLAIVLPPVAVLLCGKPVQAILNLLLTLCFWIPGVVHALFVVNNDLADERAERMIAAVKQETMGFLKAKRGRADILNVFIALSVCTEHPYAGGLARDLDAMQGA